MDSARALREAVSSCIETHDDPSIEARHEALSELARLLEDVIRDGLADRELAASLDGLVPRTVTSDETGTLHISGVLWTLGLGHGGSLGLPMEADLSLQPETVSVLRVADRRALLDSPKSERQFQRALASAVWQHTFELRLG